MDKLAVFFILSFFLLGFSSALKLSPTQTTLIVNQYETNCTSIWVLPYENFTITSKWVKDGNGNLSKYILLNEKIGLELYYKYLSDGKYEFCFTPSKGGNLSGIIYFYSIKNNVEIGSWIDLKVRQVSQVERINLITSNVIKNYGINTTNVCLGTIFVLLMFILYLIIKKLRFTSFKDKHPQINKST